MSLIHKKIKFNMKTFCVEEKLDCKKGRSVKTILKLSLIFVLGRLDRQSISLRYSRYFSSRKIIKVKM